MIFRNILFSLLLISSSLLAENNYDFIVSQYGDGNYKTVQEAINAVPDFRAKETVIFIKNGAYKEKLTLPTSKTNVTFVGESVEKTILTYDDFAQKQNRFGENLGTTGSSSFFIFGDNFTARNITFENSAGQVGQAVAVRSSGDKLVFQNCRFIGNQDTLYPNKAGSRQYFQNCYIEGTVDFIFGWATAWFEECEIFCKRGGYITAASTEESSNHGFVFNNCKIDGSAPKESFYLGRPWRDYAQTVFLNCYMSDIIRPVGWHNWGKTHAEKTAFYAEYKSYGPGAQNINERVSWSHQLSDEKAKQYTIENVLGGLDEWNPLIKIVK